MVRAFPKIFAFGSKPVLSILNNDIEVTEKLDGSQLVFGVINNKLYMRSKGRVLDLNYPDNLFIEGVEYIQRIKDLLPEDKVFYCEYLKKPKHNTLKYNVIPKNHLMLFGMSNFDGIFEQDYQGLSMWSNHLNIDVAPLVYSGKILGDPMVPLRDWLQTESFLGGPKIEGVVIKNYVQSVLIGQVYFPMMAAKFVSEEFKEIHGATWKGDHTAKGGLDRLKESLCHEQRWLKAVQYMRDDGQLLEQPQDIGGLIKRVHTDIIEEEKESIKDALWGLFHKEILGASTRGLAEWWKEKLVKDAYNEREDTSNMG